MNIHRAAHLGMCFGVRDAIQLALDSSKVAPATVLGELVHNPTVLAQLRREGIQIATSLENVRTGRVMITAHGASERRIQEARARGFEVTEATCPLVRVAHQALASLVAAGYHPVIIGLRHHVEVRGLTEDLQQCDVVLSESDVDALAERPRFGVMSQTTQPLARVRALVDRLRGRFPAAEVRWMDTVCQPTKQRQQSAEDLAQQCHVVVVVGGAHSNNTRQLAATCRTRGARVYHVETADELDPAWFEGIRDVGLTAGTSTPDAVIDAVERRLREIAAADRPRTNRDALFEAAPVSAGS